MEQYQHNNRIEKFPLFLKSNSEMISLLWSCVREKLSNEAKHNLYFGACNQRSHEKYQLDPLPQSSSTSSPGSTLDSLWADPERSLFKSCLETIYNVHFVETSSFQLFHFSFVQSGILQIFRHRWRFTLSDLDPLLAELVATDDLRDRRVRLHAQRARGGVVGVPERHLGTRWCQDDLFCAWDQIRTMRTMRPEIFLTWEVTSLKNCRKAPVFNGKLSCGVLEIESLLKNTSRSRPTCPSTSTTVLVLALCLARALDLVSVQRHQV